MIENVCLLLSHLFQLIMCEVCTHTLYVQKTLLQVCFLPVTVSSQVQL